MKKLTAMVLCFLFAFSAAGCGKADLSQVKIDYGTSSLYTETDMDAAIREIKKKFSTFDGCTLYSLSYTSDEYCNNAETLAWMNELEKANDNKEVFTRCISFNSRFRSPRENAGAWQPDEEYTWSWWLARSDGGAWKLMSWGY